MIDYVQTGERLKASTVNGIIDNLPQAGFNANNGIQFQACNGKSLYWNGPDLNLRMEQIPEASSPKPFTIKTEVLALPLQGISTALSVVQNSFYYNNEERKIADWRSGKDASKISALYLAYDSHSDEWSIMDQKKLSTETTKTQWKLYDMTSGNVECDYRDAHLEIYDNSNSEGYGTFRWEYQDIDETTHIANITHCNFQFGRAVYSLNDFSFTSETPITNTYYLMVPHDDPNDAVILPANTGTSLTQTVIPLFTVRNGKITSDYRGMPVIPVWSTPTT